MGERHDQRFKGQVVAAYQDRLSIRGPTRTFGVRRETGLRWVGEKSGGPARLRGHAAAAEQGDVLALDELWNFVARKAGQLWLWVAPCRRTRQVVGWTLGNRSQQSACDLRASLAPDHRRCATRSDYWDAYAAAFPKHISRCGGEAEGETSHVERWFGTLRARLRRLVRRAYSFSKNAENPLDAIHLFITSYNLAVQRQATVR